MYNIDLKILEDEVKSNPRVHLENYFNYKDPLDEYHEIASQYNSAISQMIDYSKRKSLNLADNEIYQLTLSNPESRNIYVTQPYCISHVIHNYAKSNKLPFLLKYKDEYFILDGHHRIIRKTLDSKPIKCWVYEVK